MSELSSFLRNKKLESHKKVCENKDFCNLVMPKDVKVLDFNQNQKSDKAGIIIYADLECVIEKIDVYRGKDYIKKVLWIVKRARNEHN